MVYSESYILPQFKTKQMNLITIKFWRNVQNRL